MKYVLALLAFILIMSACATTKPDPAQFRKEAQSVVIVRFDAVVEDDVTGAPIETAWSGTGFSVRSNADGSEILTNAHVCSGGNRGTYTLTDVYGHKVSARFVRIDPLTDLCLLATRAQIQPLRLAASNARRFEPVFELGAPHGSMPWLSAGYASGYEAIRLDEDGVFQLHVAFRAQGFTAQTYPGNSGSPIVNADGQVVGIAFASSRNAEHMAFMVPVELIHQFLDTENNIQER